jgi:hypothetical protein
MEPRARVLSHVLQELCLVLRPLSYDNALTSERDETRAACFHGPSGGERIAVVWGAEVV